PRSTRLEFRPVASSRCYLKAPFARQRSRQQERRDERHARTEIESGRWPPAWPGAEAFPEDACKEAGGQSGQADRGVVDPVSRPTFRGRNQVGDEGLRHAAAKGGIDAVA